jgi:hypothetical protein
MPQSQTNADLGPGVVNFDYDRWFPHIFWVSQWASDDSYPNGYCYKLLSARDELSGCVEFAVILAERNGDKQELTRFSIPLAEARGAAQLWIDGLSKRFNLNFEEQDYSSIRTREAFNAQTQKYGWSMNPQ